MTWPFGVGGAAAGLEALRDLATIGMLAGAAVLDLRQRRVPNRYWFPFVGAAALGLLADAALSLPGGWPDLAVADGVAVVMCGLFWLLFQFGMFGGADAKGLMVVALLMPRMAPGGLPVPAAIGILAIGSAAAALLPLWLVAWNVAHGQVRMPAAFVGIHMQVARARGAKVWPMEEILPDGTRKVRYDMRLRADRAERSAARFAALEAAGVESAWFAPQVPLVAFLWVGALAWFWVRAIPLPTP